MAMSFGAIKIIKIVMRTCLSPFKYAGASVWLNYNFCFFYANIYRNDLFLKFSTVFFHPMYVWLFYFLIFFSSSREKRFLQSNLSKAISSQFFRFATRFLFSFSLKKTLPTISFWLVQNFLTFLLELKYHNLFFIEFNVPLCEMAFPLLFIGLFAMTMCAFAKYLYTHIAVSCVKLHFN